MSKERARHGQRHGKIIINADNDDDNDNDDTSESSVSCDDNDDIQSVSRL